MISIKKYQVRYRILYFPEKHFRILVYFNQRKDACTSAVILHTLCIAFSIMPVVRQYSDTVHRIPSVSYCFVEPIIKKSENNSILLSRNVGK